MQNIGIIKDFKHNGYYLINAYFYNDHDIEIMGKWSRDTKYEWDHLIIIYINSSNEIKSIKKKFTRNNGKFTIHELPHDKHIEYPIRAILVPSQGYGKKTDIKSLSDVSEVDLYNIDSKQIFW